MISDSTKMRFCIKKFIYFLLRMFSKLLLTKHKIIKKCAYSQYKNKLFMSNFINRFLYINGKMVTYFFIR